MAKKGRPTEAPKTFILQVRISEETKKELDKICAEKKMTRSEVIRVGIELQKKTDC